MTKSVTNPEENQYVISTDILDNIQGDEFKNFFHNLWNETINHEIRMVFTSDSRPVAALVPFHDLQMLIDYVQHEVDPSRWVELVNDTKTKLGETNE